MKPNNLKALAVFILALSQHACSFGLPVPSAIAFEQTARGKELNGIPQILAPAPDDCLQTLRMFLSYCFDGESNIRTDAASQDRWLTPELKQQVVDHERMARDRRKEYPTDRIDSVSNKDFIGFWDLPTAFVILGSRHYGNQAVVDIEYSWSSGTEYEGNRERVSYSLRFDGKTWRVDDLFQFRGPYVTTGLCLSQRLRNPF